MKSSKLRGIGFGLTSGIITTLGLMIGLFSSTHSKLIVIGGIITIAVADAMSDALGIHISIESEGKYKVEEIWESTIATFFTKFIFALLFIIPILLFNLSTAVVVNVVWSLILMIGFNAYIAKRERKKPYKVIGEHLLIAVTVIILTYYLGKWVDIWFA